ncbi:MAG: dihydrodipicolinate synthase family protein [Atribacterota bacterium]|nr:dihydrodipicolinate synthase family protein [Atribacterota bacterium]MDD4896886.1 dihydrodipicolinate synthase family protein [Atribacterota bacterium]MDD5637739.1 dihydrodipicolinate synthase family protein [Atribacterota bacterium]
MKRMKNIVVPTITPFDKNGEIDIEGIKVHYDFLIKKGVKDFYILGTTGEVFLMNIEERKKTAELIINHVGDRGNVFVHTGSISTKEACELGQHAEKIGAAGIGAVTPFYFNVSQYEMENYYYSIAESVSESFPVYLYNLPGCTTNDLLPETVSKLAKVENIVGIKNSMSDIFRLSRLIDETPNDFDVIIGSDPIIMPAMLYGAKGSVSGNANVFPEVFLEFYQALKENNYEKAHEKQIAIRHIAMILKDGANLAYFKQALVYRGFKQTFTRKPLLGLHRQEKEELNKEVQEIIRKYL